MSPDHPQPIEVQPSPETAHPDPTLQPDSPIAGSSPVDAPQRKRRKWVLPAALLGLVALGGGGFLLLSRPGGGPPPQQRMPVNINTAPVTITPIEDSSDYVASLESRQSVTLQPRVAGQVSEIFVRSGDRVEAGQVLLQIDPREQQATVASRVAAVEASQADVEASRAEVASAQQALQALQAQRNSRLADLQFNQREYERFQQLAREGAESQRVLDQRLNQLRTAQASLAEVEADIQAQRATIARAQANIARNQGSVTQAQAGVEQEQAALGYYTITAPFSGVVGNVPIKEGDFANTSTQLMTITQNTQLEVQISVPVEDAPRLRNGLPVRLLDANNKVLQTGRIFFVSPNVNPQTQAVLVRARFDNPGNRLRTEQFVRARVVWGQKPNGVLIPVTAVSAQAGKDFVFIPERYDARCKAKEIAAGNPEQSLLKDDQLVVRQQGVQLDKYVGNNREVVSGLNPGDRVAVNNILQLTECSPIVDQPASADLSSQK
ncbi:MAG: efflux RND transporter periplasmic adaptor subunit [Leptolyngbyaceae cyanobacterium bins.59]|nr:efflux RND transporter periplasmic adaptor subunit [Leptolyngbyaceae cyanobacterium bins.59]